jgi:hypothetical protein
MKPVRRQSHGEPEKMAKNEIRPDQSGFGDVAPPAVTSPVPAG